MKAQDQATVEGKSLGEKLADAVWTRQAILVLGMWSMLPDDARTDYERVGLTFAASLSHDETATATIASLRSALTAAEEENKNFRAREAHFAKALKVADGGQYRNDWDAAISAVVARATASEARAARLEELLKPATGVIPDQAWSGNRGNYGQMQEAAATLSTLSLEEKIARLICTHYKDPLVTLEVPPDAFDYEWFYDWAWERSIIRARAILATVHTALSIQPTKPEGGA